MREYNKHRLKFTQSWDHIYNYYVYKNAKRPRQYSNISKSAVQVVDMAATIHMVPPTRASIFSQVPLYIMYFYKSSDDDHARHAVLDFYPEQNLKSWTQQQRGLDVAPHGDDSTPILRNDCESYLQMCRIKELFSGCF